MAAGPDYTTMHDDLHVFCVNGFELFISMDAIP